jgi:hypothetical protein
VRLAPLLLERFASLVTTVVFFLGWLSVPRAVLTEPLAPGAQSTVRLLRCAIPADSRKGFLPPISGVTFFLRRLLSFERAVGIAKLSQMRDRDFLLS